jgi:serine/threonine protein kinase
MMNHPNVIKLVAVLNRNSQLLMLLENGRAIHTLLPPNYQMREQIVKKYMKEVAMGLEYIHGLGYVHRDLKPANLVVSTNDVAKIIDFGGAVHLASLHRDSKIQYTTQYLAIGKLAHFVEF